jgi:hypothetical protein
MSIDYTANYGIGYAVCESEEISESEELEDGLEEYVYSEVGDGFESFSTNSGNDTETEAVYVTIKDPFKDGLCLADAKAKLDAELQRMKLEPECQFGAVGGMCVF